MKGLELYARVRRAVVVEGKSQRAVAREFGIDPRTVAKMVRYPEPPGYRRTKPPKRPKLDGFTEIINVGGEKVYPAEAEKVLQRAAQDIAHPMGRVERHVGHLEDDLHAP